MADELDTETLVSRALSRLREAQSLLESRSGESISQSAVAVLDAAGDLTTAWGKHLAGLPAPKAEEERKALLAAGGSAGGDDLTTLVSQLLGAPDTQASTVTSVQVTDFVAIGASPAQSGALRLANNQAIMARNAANDGDISLLTAVGDNIFLYGAGNGSLTIGAGSALLRVNGVLALGTAGNGQFFAMHEAAASPGIADPNQARIWLQDNGSGKSQLMIQFATGAPVQIAIQP